MKREDLFRSAGFTVALMIVTTLFSKLLGMLRQMMTAGIFAASIEGIAFSAASGIPLAIFDMLFSAAVLGSFLPIYKGYLVSDAERARSFSSSFFTFVLLITAGAALLGIALARPIIVLAAPELDPATASLAVMLLRIMFPSMIFAGAAYILVGILQSRESFLLPASVSAVSNLVMLLYLWLCPAPIGKNSVVGLALAYLISWLAQFLMLAVPLLRRRVFPKLTVRCLTSDSVLAVKRALPVMCGSWLIPMTTLIAKALSSLVDPASVETGAHAGTAIVVYENAFSVFSIAAGLLTYGICNYLFPKLSGRYAKGDGEGFLRLAEEGCFASLAVVMPIAGAVGLLSEEIVALLYLRGAFTPGLAAAAAESLRILSLAVPAYCVIEFFSRVFYSCGKVRYPMRASLCGISVMLLAGVGFFLTERLSVRTVSLSAVCGQWTAGALLLVFYTHTLGKRKCVYGVGKYASVVFSSLLSFAAMRLCRDFLRDFFHFSPNFQNFLIMGLVFTVGFVVHLLWLIATKTVRISDPRKSRGS